uniref:F-box domain-containing protein n=1 Tax=Panagrolaimus sp. ES5 TaxID=591445 RepID=A0AC34FIB9_9BILA
MLLNLPILCQLEILQRLPPTSIDTSALLPKVRVFMAITNEMDLENVTICVYLHPIHYNGNMEGCMKRRIYKQLLVKITDLPTFDLQKHFGLFELESILLTSRHRQISPISFELTAFVSTLILSQPKLRYFSARSLDFKHFEIDKIKHFLEAFQNLHRLDIFKLDSCHFQDFKSIYAIYSSSILTKTRQFREVCTTREHSDLENPAVMKETNAKFFNLLQSEEEDNTSLEVLDISSSINWPFGSFVNFIEVNFLVLYTKTKKLIIVGNFKIWICSKSPKPFKSFTVMRTPEFESIVEELKAHPWKVSVDEPLIFKNKHNENLILQVCVESVNFVFILFQ